MKKYNISFLLIFILNGFIFSQTTLHVPAQYPTIQEALNATQTGDTVLVQPGTYYENILWPNVNGIKLISAGNNTNTIIDGSDALTVISVIASGIVDTTTLIKGFSIVNGGSVDQGGGITLNGVGLSIAQCKISNNFSNEDGGGIYLSNSSLVIKNSKITNNIAQGAGNGRGAGVYSENSQLFIENCLISENDVRAGTGGGLYITSTTGFLKNSELKFNISSHSNTGGGGAITAGSYDFIIDNVIFYENISNHGGGAVLGFSLQIKNSTFVNNISNHHREGGGAIVTYGNCVLKNNSFISNVSETFGGAIEIRGDNDTITHSTFYRNNAGSLGDGISMNDASANVILYNNFKNNGYGIFNRLNTVIIEANNNYWGASNGPYHQNQNPNGNGDSVNIFVNILPFLTTPDTDAPPIPPDNVNVISNTENSLTVEWDSCHISDLGGYNIYYDSDSAGYPYSNYISIPDINIFTVENLTTGLTYYIAVTCIDTEGNESWYSDEVSVFLLPVPQTPILISPPNESLDQPLNITLEWNQVSYVDYYRVQFTDDSTFNEIIIDDSTLTSNNKQISDLTEIHKYYWRVKATNTSGSSNFSNAWNFTSLLNAPQNLIS